MENNNDVNKEKLVPMNKTLVAAGIVAISITVFFYFVFNNGGEQVEAKFRGGNDDVAVITPTPNSVSYGNYKDGTYTVEGDYMSPGGNESIQVKVTLKNNLISEADVTANATRPMSKKFQEMFMSGYKQYVVGKSINDVKLDKISGSSLTSNGFNDAIEKIKTEAKV